MMRHKGYARMAFALVFLVMMVSGFVSRAAPELVPSLREWGSYPGTLRITTDSVIAVRSADYGAVSNVVVGFHDDLLRVSGLDLRVVQTNAAPADGFYITLDAPSDAFDCQKSELKEEGYVLEISDSVVLSAGGVRGAVNGMQTVLQLLLQQPDRASLPKGRARDWPAYADRGIMIDCARKYFQPEYLKFLIREMAWRKLDSLHLHLSEWNGYRLESALYPGLAFSNHYSRAEIEELKAYAEKYAIELIPEIDMPGHSTTMTAYNPDLAFPDSSMWLNPWDDPDTKYWSIDVTRQANRDWCFDLIDETMDLFSTSPWFHIGGDEIATVDNMNAATSLVAFVTNNIASNAKSGDAFVDFFNAVDDTVRAKGKRLMIWNDWSDLPRITSVHTDVVVNCWSADADGFMAEGYQTVALPYNRLYLTPGQNLFPKNRDNYENWTLEDGENPLFRGYRMAVWADKWTDRPDSDFEYYLKDARDVLSEITWGGPRSSTVEDFYARSARVGAAPTNSAAPPPPAAASSLELSGPSTVGSNAYCTLSFSASSDVSGMLVWSNALNGATGSVASAASGSLENVPLDSGYNTIRISGVNDAGHVVWAEFVVLRKTWADGTYFIDSENGLDSNSGTAPNLAWRTLAKVNAHTLAPGESFLFKAGSDFSGQQLRPSGSGTSSARIRIDRYGEGDDPKFDAQGNYEATVLLENMEYLDVAHLDVANFGDQRAGNKENRRGLVFSSVDYGTVHSVHIRNVNIHDVNGSLIKGHYEGVGLLMHCDGPTPSNFDDVLIENCRIIRCDRNAIDMKTPFYMSDSYDPSTRTRTGGNWFPSYNVVLRGNFIQDIGGDCIKVIGCDGALIEHNVARYGVQRCSDAAAGIWPWSSDNCIFQYNEACYMKNNGDGQGFDSDDNCANNIFQYNYSHDNEGGFFLIIGVSYEVGSIGLYNTIIRYNISENDAVDGKYIFRIAGDNIHDTTIDNNTIYKKSGTDIYLFKLNNTSEIPKGPLWVRNNIVQTDGLLRNDWKGYSDLHFENNIFYGNISDLPAGSGRIETDPRLLASGIAGDGTNWLCAYVPAENSPAIDSGVSISNAPSIDILGTALPQGMASDRGACEYAGTRCLKSADDRYLVRNSTTLDVSAPGVLANDVIGLPGSTATVDLVRSPEHGSLELHADGSFSYIPDEGVFRGDSFIYCVGDESESVTSTVQLVGYDPIPVARWSFDESGGDLVVDGTGNGHDGTMDGGGRVDGYDGRALELQVDDEVRIANPLRLTNEWSVTFFAKVPAGTTRNWHEDALRTEDVANIALLNWENGKVAYGHPYVFDLEFNYTLPDDRWVFLAFIAHGTQVSLYVDGAYVDRIDTGTLNPCPADTIGCASQSFPGLLDDLRIFDFPLSEEQLRTVLNPNNPDPIASWRFDEASGDLVVDGTGNGHDGTLNGGVRTNGYIRGGILLNTDAEIPIKNPPPLSGDWTVSMRVMVPEGTTRVGHEDIMRTEGIANIALRNWENGRVAFGHPGMYDLEFDYTLPEGQWVQLVFAAHDTSVDLYVNGNHEDTVNSSEINYCPLHSIGSPGHTFNGILDDLCVFSRTLSAGEIASLFNPDAPSFFSDPVLGNDAQADNAYAGSLASEAEDPNGDSIFFSKISGAQWLSVSPDGDLSGTPSLADIGTNLFSVSVTDNTDGSSYAQLQIVVNQPDGSPPPSLSATRRLRLVWADDPSSTMTIGWEQTSGNAATVYYGTNDFGRLADRYPFSHGVDRVGNYGNHAIDTQFARLTGLQPDTAYYFVLKDDTGTSSRYWFRTAPNTPEPFTFVAGGDSRSNRDPRRMGNRMVTKLRPLFIAFTGDMISTDDASHWNEWFDDWQDTIASDGRMFPILPHLGNHESGGTETMYQLFDTPSGDYYALSFGGNLLRYYALNSEVEVAGAQASWLGNDLQTTGTNFIHKAAGYHKPIRPHLSSKSEQDDEYDAWAPLFYDYGVELVTEADSHVVKRTYPIRPSNESGSDEGFIRDDANGTVYIGEGTWGAPLRTADDSKTWTAGTGKFYSFDWIFVYPDQMEVVTVKFDGVDSIKANTEDSLLSLPSGIQLWHPASGTCMVVNPVQGAKTSFPQWQTEQWTDATLPVDASPTADSDQDGIDNMTEFFYGLDPHSPDTPDENSAFLDIDAKGEEASLNYHRKADLLVNTSCQMATNLASGWRTLTPDTDYVETLTPTGEYEQVEIMFSEEIALRTNAFFRVLFELSP